jgi:hypothetical protein
MVVGEVGAFGLGDRVEVGWDGGHGFKRDCCRRGDFINGGGAKIFGTSAEGYPQRIVCAWFRAILEMAS